MAKITIIGAGPGGYETAVAAAKRGFEVALVSEGPLGGTCLNEGCIPTKALCRNAEVFETVSAAAEFGVNCGKPALDFAKVQERKNGVVEQLRGGIEFLMKSNKISLYNGKASFKDEHTVLVGGQEIVSDYIIIATGSYSASLPVPGKDLPGVITSTEILNLPEVPKRLCVIGGGVIGLEFASVYKSFGSEVSVVEFCPNILPRFDTDLAKRLKQSLSKRGISIETSAQVTGIYTAADGSLEVKYLKKEKEFSVVADKVLMAVGRRPNVQSLNLDDIGVEYNPKGILVDNSLRTSIPHIFAVGDVVGGMMLAHMASYQGLVALDAIEHQQKKAEGGCCCGGHHEEEHECHCHSEEGAHGGEGHCCGGGHGGGCCGGHHGLPINLAICPAAVFTYPEAAMVGLTEEDCKKYDIPVKCLKSFYRANGKALSMGEPEGFCKLIVAQSNGMILGCHMFGAHCADIIQEVGALMNLGTTITELQSIIHAHPTLSEILKEAAHS